jgi:hypothetical protein
MKKKRTTMILITIAGIIVGGAAGFLFYKFVGCTSGACPITRNPYLSTIYGMALGFLITRAFF